MSARTRRDHPPVPVLESWQEAVAIRAEWRDAALSTARADRPAAEAAIAELYRTLGRKPPSFTWVESPSQAVAGLPAEPVRVQYGEPPDGASAWHVACRLATQVHDLRQALDRHLGRGGTAVWHGGFGWRRREAQPVAEALADGARLEDLLEVGVRDSLGRTVRDGLRTPLRAALGGAPPGLCWYGQHDAYWIAHYDAYRRLRSRGPAGGGQLDVWAALARSCGWWWPGDGWCVVTERTSAVHTEPLPGGQHGELRPHHPRGLAIEYPDGTGTHAWHGTPVPAWVIEDPTVERILAERNVEVRRCAIERLGWDTYISQAGLRLAATAADPGNPGCELRLYDLPRHVWGEPARVLLAVNGSVERDGQRRRYGLSVPADLDDPVAAAGWSYGLSAAQYAQLARRT
ncbi:MAG: DUF6745 domain-containing protein [Mycobacteriales bacterium]